MIKFFTYIFQDWIANKGNVKARLILIFFRLSHLLSTRGLFFLVIGLPVLVLYRVLVEWFLCVELPFRTQIGKSLKLYHGQALVVNNKTVIGDNCVLRHSTTIGTSKKLESGKWSGCPIIGNNVDIGANTVIVGPIIIGNNVIIGAGSVVIKDVESNTKIAGNPARVITKKVSL